MRAVYQQGIERVAATLEAGLSHLSGGKRRRRAWVILGMLAGAWAGAVNCSETRNGELATTPIPLVAGFNDSSLTRCDAAAT